MIILMMIIFITTIATKPDSETSQINQLAQSLIHLSFFISAFFPRKKVQECIIIFVLNIDIKYTNKQTLGRKGVGRTLPSVSTEKALFFINIIPIICCLMAIGQLLLHLYLLRCLMNVFALCSERRW